MDYNCNREILWEIIALHEANVPDKLDNVFGFTDACWRLLQLLEQEYTSVIFHEDNYMIIWAKF